MVILKIYCGYFFILYYSANQQHLGYYILLEILSSLNFNYNLLSWFSFILFSLCLSISVQIPLVCPEVKLSPLLFSSPSLSPSSSLPS